MSLDEKDNLPAFSVGAKIKPANLVSIRHLAVQLPLHRQKRILSDLSGSHASAVRGRGLDFSEVRGYQPGDDIRTMDWRVTARTDEPHIKVFREERERPVLIVCDLRSNMHFATRRAFKSVLAADMAALFAWAALNNGDRIGAVIFNDEQEVDLRPKTGRKQVMHVLHELASLPASHNTDPNQRMQQICRHIRRMARPGTAIYFISDWHGFDKECERQLFNVTRQCDLIALQIYDAIEEELPPPGLYNLTNRRQKITLDTHSLTARIAHQQAYAQQQQSLNQHMRRLKVPLIRLATHDDPMPVLRPGLGLSAKASGLISSRSSH